MACRNTSKAGIHLVNYLGLNIKVENTSSLQRFNLVQNNNKKKGPLHFRLLFDI